MNILHITTHMGGGVGHALSDLTLWDKQNKHKIIILQKPEKYQYIKACLDSGIDIIECPTMESIGNIIKYADIVILHWWHHPIMCKFLYGFPNIPVRLVLWSHISGCSYPALTYQFANKFLRVFLTSEYSLENLYWSNKEREEIRKKIKIVYGLGKRTKMEHKQNYEIKDDILKIGYIGTLAKSKIHPEFPIICKRILQILPKAEFFLLGDAEDGKWIIEQAEILKIAEKIHIVGFVEDINDWLLSFDIFGYPLNPYHFGTTENSVLEAMTVGLPIVLFDQATEKYIISQNVDGILAKDIEDYTNTVVQLAKDEKLRIKLGKNAVYNVEQKFSFEKNLKNFQKAVKELELEMPQEVNFNSIIGEEPYDWFISGLNESDKENLLNDRLDELDSIFFERSKSSIFHFARTYPQDKQLHDMHMKVIRWKES